MNYVTINQLLDLKKGKIWFDSYKDLLGWKSEERAKSMAKKWMKLLLEETMKAMIDEAGILALPIRCDARIYIADLAARSSYSSRKVFPGLKPTIRHHCVLVNFPLQHADRHKKNGKRGYYRVRLEYQHKLRIQQRLDEGVIYCDA